MNDAYPQSFFSVLSLLALPQERLKSNYSGSSPSCIPSDRSILSIAPILAILVLTSGCSREAVLSNPITPPASPPNMGGFWDYSLVGTDTIYGRWTIVDSSGSGGQFSSTLYFNNASLHGRTSIAMSGTVTAEGATDVVGQDSLGRLVIVGTATGDRKSFSGRLWAYDPRLVLQSSHTMTATKVWP